MDKSEVVRALNEMASLLEILEASRFEYSAYKNAASAVQDWQGDLVQSVRDGKVTDIPTVGKGTGQFISELIEHGAASELEQVRGKVPAQLPLLLRFRGLGPRKVKLLWRELNIEGLDDLEKAIDNGEVASLKGFGQKSIDSMRESIAYFRNESQGETQRVEEEVVVPKAIHSTGKIFAGTSGYSYPVWKGTFYPPKAKTAELLSHYAEKLNSVEINNTFYRFPSEKVVAQWRDQSPPDFQFSLKAHRRVTHQMRLNDSSRVKIKEFVERCSILGTRLGCILFQLPPDFERDDKRLANLLDSIPTGPRYALEFRHASWHDDQVYRQLKECNVACVAGDSARDDAVKVITADFVYVRLRKEAYTSNELQEWNLWFSACREEKRDVLVFLKHDDTGDAPIAITDMWYPD